MNKFPLPPLANPAQLEELSWKAHDNFYTYDTSRTARPFEIHSLENIRLYYEVKTSLVLTYRLAGDDGEQGDSVHHFGFPVLMFCITGFNSAHTLSHVISFAEFYSRLSEEMPHVAREMRIGVPSEMQELIPHVYSVLRKLLPWARFICLEKEKVYSFKNLTMRRNSWFTALNKGRLLDAKQTLDLLSFEDLSWAKHSFSDDILPLLRLAKNIHDDNIHRYDSCEKIIVFKVADGSFMQTPHRALTLTDEARHFAADKGYKFLFPTAIESTEEYITKLHSAKIAIFSYGGPTCTNRFFLNRNASVLVVAHESYRGEWDVKHPEFDFPHIRQSHICPVLKQRFLLNVPDLIDIDEMRKIIDHAES